MGKKGEEARRERKEGAVFVHEQKRKKASRLHRSQKKTIRLFRRKPADRGLSTKVGEIISTEPGEGGDPHRERKGMT